MAPLRHGSFGGKAAVVGLHMLTTLVKCLRCNSMLVWIATEVRCRRVAIAAGLPCPDYPNYNLLLLRSELGKGVVGTAR